MGYSDTVIRNGYEYTWDGSEYVATHREIYFTSDRGKTADQKCYWCAKPLSLYGSKDHRLVVDHLDNDRLNNDSENLVASCRDCNLFRGKLDKWVSGMPPGRFSELMKVTSQNWDGTLVNSQRMVRAAIYMSEILKAASELLGIEAAALMKKLREECGRGDPASALEVIFEPLFYSEGDIFGNEHPLLETDALSKKLLCLWRAAGVEQNDES